MAYEPGKNSYTALIIGAIVVAAALLLFFLFSTGGDQQASFDQPSITAPKEPGNAPAAPPAKSPPETGQKQPGSQ